MSTTWTQTSAPSSFWESITSDSTGKYLAAVINSGGIYISSNYGSTWTQTSAPSAAWFSITSDSTGQYLAAVNSGGGGGGAIYFSALVPNATTNTGSNITNTYTLSVGNGVVVVIILIVE